MKIIRETKLPPEEMLVFDNNQLVKRWLMDVVLTQNGDFRSTTIANESDIAKLMQELPKTFISNFEKIDYLEFVDGQAIQVEFSKYVPLRGAKHIQLPPYIANKKAIINVQNQDTRCFEYAVLSALHPQEKHADRPSKYAAWLGELDFTNIAL